MKLFASGIFKKEARGKGKDKIGRIVNLIMDTESLEARVLVFPEVRSGSWIWDMIPSTESLLSPVTESLGIYNGSIITGRVDQIGQKLQKKQLDREERANQTYLLIPVSEISKIDDRKLDFEQESEEYGSFINMPVGEADVAFYHDGAYKDPKRLFGISLNLVALRGLSLRDPEKRKGRIIDLRFDVMEGLTSELVVRTPGKGVLGRRIDARDIDFPSLACKKSIGCCPELARSK